MKLELWRLFREDVRDLFELTTSNMNTYMVVGSLLDPRRMLRGFGCVVWVLGPRAWG